MNMLEIARKTNEVSEYWGNLMPMMVMEEAGELIQAISKYERTLAKNGTEEDQSKARKNLIDEIGDMWISLMALQSHYEDGTWGDLIDSRIKEKLNKKY